MIDQLVQLLKRLPTHPTLTAIIDRADKILGQSKLANGEAVYKLLSDIEELIRSNQENINRVKTTRAIDTITGYEEHKGTDNTKKVAAIHQDKSSKRNM